MGESISFARQPRDVCAADVYSVPVYSSICHTVLACSLAKLVDDDDSCTASPRRQRQMQRHEAEKESFADSAHSYELVRGWSRLRIRSRVICLQHL
jgi:hypothetical protein